MAAFKSQIIQTLSDLTACHPDQIKNLQISDGGGVINVDFNIEIRTSSDPTPKSASENLASAVTNGQLSVTFLDGTTASAQSNSLSVTLPNETVSCYQCTGTTSCARQQNSNSVSQSCSSNEICMIVATSSKSSPSFARECREHLCYDDKSNLAQCSTSSGIQVCTQCCRSNYCNSGQLQGDSSSLQISWISLLLTVTVTVGIRVMSSF